MFYGIVSAIEYMRNGFSGRNCGKWWFSAISAMISSHTTQQLHSRFGAQHFGGLCSLTLIQI